MNKYYEEPEARECGECFNPRPFHAPWCDKNNWEVIMSLYSFEPAESEFEDVEDELSMSEDEWIAKMLSWALGKVTLTAPRGKSKEKVKNLI